MKSNKVVFKIPEIKNFIIKKLIIKEAIGDSISSGVLSIIQDIDSIDLNIKELNISFIVNGNYEYKCKAFVESVDEMDGAIDYQLVFCTEEFYKVTKIAKYKGIKSLLSLYPGEVLNEMKFDSEFKELDIYQNNLTNYKLLGKYLKSAKIDQLYTYRFDGLFFTDTTKDPEKELDLKFFDKKLPIGITRVKLKDLKINIEKFEVSKLSNVYFNNSLITVATPFGNLMKNFYENEKNYLCSESNIPITASDLIESKERTDVRAGDLVKGRSNKYEGSKYLVVSNLITVTYNEYAQTLLLNEL